MKTPMQELIEWMKNLDNRNLQIARYDLDLKINDLLEKEKQIIIEAVDYGQKYHEGFDFDGKQYYNETFKQ